MQVRSLFYLRNVMSGISIYVSIHPSIYPSTYVIWLQNYVIEFKKGVGNDHCSKQDKIMRLPAMVNLSS